MVKGQAYSKPIVLISMASSRRTQGWVSVTVRFPFKMPHLTAYEKKFFEKELREGVLGALLIMFGGSLVYRGEPPKPSNENQEWPTIS